jgi:hypothetical protein
MVAGGAALAGLAHPLTAAAQSAAMAALLDYVQGQQTTGFLIVQDRKTLVEKN